MNTEPQTRWTIQGEADPQLSNALVLTLLSEVISQAGKQGLHIQVVEVEKP